MAAAEGDIVGQLTRQLALQRELARIATARREAEAAGNAIGVLQMDAAADLARLEDSRLDLQGRISGIKDDQIRATAEILENTLAILRADEIRRGVAADITTELERQKQATIDAAGPIDTSARDGAQGELQRLQNIVKFGTEGAETFGRIQEMVMSGSMSLTEAMDLENAIRDTQKLADAVQRMEQLYQESLRRIATALEDGLVRGIESALTGAEKLNDVLQDVAAALLRDLGRMFIRAGINGLGASMDLPGFANGGVIAPNTTAIVGERGPEIIRTGSQSTHVMSNSESRRALDQYSYREPARLPLNYSPSFETVQFGDDRYVTVETMNAAVQQGMAIAAKQGAKSGETRVMSRFRNSRSTRKQLGL